MNLLLGFAPFAAFALLSHAFSANAGLLAGALVSAALVVREIVAGRAPKILELGTLLLFALLSAWSVATEANWPLMQVRLMVDAGLLLIVLGSLLIGKPFTLQ